MVHQQQAVQLDSIQQQPAPSQGRDSEHSYISYRQRRRISQGQRQNGKKNTRGTSRGVKYRDERDKRLGINPSCAITNDMKRIIGPNASQFITEVSHLVRSQLPLNCRGWNDMEYEKKERLLTRIKAEWNFPEGENVDEIVKKQCQQLYRHWRYRLKEKHFTGFTIAEAIKNRPEGVDPDQWRWLVRQYWGTEKAKRISEANRFARSKQKVKGNQGSKSTARIMDMMQKYQAGTTSQTSTQATQDTEDGNQPSQDTGDGTQPSQGTVIGSNELESPTEPEYIKLWVLTKRHKDNSWDKAAEEKLEEFKELHKQQLEIYGSDNLTVQEAYLKVLGTSSGYINGLGYGPKPPKRISEGRAGGEGIDIAHQMAQQMEQMEKNQMERESELKGEIERLKEDKVQMEKNQMERESELKAEMHREIEKLKRDAEAREAKLHADFLAMQAKMAAFFAANPQT